jgi:hypothetical protein
MFVHSSLFGLFPTLITGQASSNFVPGLNWNSFGPTLVVPPSAHVWVAPDVTAQPAGVPLAKVAKPGFPWKQFQSVLPLVFRTMLPSPDSKLLGLPVTAPELATKKTTKNAAATSVAPAYHQRRVRRWWNLKAAMTELPFLVAESCWFAEFHGPLSRGSAIPHASLPSFLTSLPTVGPRAPCVTSLLLPSTSRPEGRVSCQPPRLKSRRAPSAPRDGKARRRPPTTADAVIVF